MRRKESFDGVLWGRAKEAIAHGALTNSKRPESFVLGVYPTHLKSSLGCDVWDTNHNRYIDFTGALGTNLLGFRNEEICEAIRGQLYRGISFPLGSLLEIEVAERVKEFFPFIERLRFLKTGSEACSAAVRIARARTGRKNILSEGYHGWHDEFTSLTPPALGVNPSPYVLPFRVEWFEKFKSDTAAVIVEPVITDISPHRIAWLKELRKKCTDYGVLLIFDEIITGLRYPHYSVSQAHGITPDLICLGKALGGGLPLSVVGGKKEIMESDYFVSSTFAGDTLSLAACKKTLDLLQNKFKIDYLWEKGAQFLFRFNEIWREGLVLEGYPTRSVLKGDDLTKALFMQECARAGILVGSSLFFTFPHIEVMDQVLSIFRDILERIRLGPVSLIGQMPIKPYVEKVRQAT